MGGAVLSMQPLTVGSLFAGIGGFDLGFERAGMRTVWQVEQDLFCRSILARHFPWAERFEDVCEVGSGVLRPVDVICGGFPCQDLSYAGKGAGLDGARSGLWREYARIVGELRPRYVVVENVPALLGRGLGIVLGDLAALGYDAEWDCLPASAFGAPHRRDRIWIVAYPGGLAVGEEQVRERRGEGSSIVGADGEDGDASDSGGEGLERRVRAEAAWEALSFPAASGCNSWSEGPPVAGVCGVGYGFPDWVDRLKSLGNALVPQIAEWIGCRIVAYEEGCND